MFFIISVDLFKYILTNLTNVNRIATAKNRMTRLAPGTDSKTEKAKLCQFCKIINGSEKIKETNGPKLDSERTSLKPIIANVESMTKTAKPPIKNPRFLLII